MEPGSCLDSRGAGLSGADICLGTIRGKVGEIRSRALEHYDGEDILSTLFAKKK